MNFAHKNMAEKEYGLREIDKLLFLLEKKSPMSLVDIKRDMISRPEPPYNHLEGKRLDEMMLNAVGDKLITEIKERGKNHYEISEKGKELIDKRFNELMTRYPDRTMQWLYYLGM